MDQICVSIFILTYNQERFIAQTLDSVLMQKTSFNYQLVIGEDLSTDDTRSICEQYAIKHGEKVKLLNSDQKYGLIQNFIRTLKECDGKYIAVCDGDDYWTDPYKLQKQLDFLENNLDYSIVYTGIKNLYPTGEFRLKTWPEIKDFKDFNQLIFANFIPSVTAFYRNKQHVEDFPYWIENFPYGDWPIYLWVTQNGEKIGYLNEVTAVYRKEIGVSEKLKKVPSDIAEVNFNIVKCIYRDKRFANKKEIVRRSLQQHKFSLMACYFRERKFCKSFKNGKSLLINNPVKVIRTYLYLFKRIYLNNTPKNFNNEEIIKKNHQ